MRRSLVIGIIAILCISIGVLFFYTSEWRLNEELRFVKTGSVVIQGISNAHVYIDEKKIDVTERLGTLEVLHILPGPRTILVTQNDTRPWTKQIIVESGAITEVRPFLTPTLPRSRVLQNDDPLYEMSQTSFSTNRIPTPTEPLSSPDNMVDIYVRENILGAVWRGATSTIPHFFCVQHECGPINVLKTQEGAIRSVAFYGNRNDVLIVAVTNGIFALDLNPIGTQNFQPLYMGTEPEFTSYDDHTLFVRDGAFMVELAY